MPYATISCADCGAAIDPDLADGDWCPSCYDRNARINEEAWRDV